MKGRLKSRAAGDARVLVARVAWLVLYPLTVALIVVSMGSRFAELTAADAGAGTLLRPAGGTYGLALFALEALLVVQFVANTLLMAWLRNGDWVALYTSIGGPTFLLFMFPASEALIAADPRWAGAVVAAQWLGAAMPVPYLLFFPDGRFVPRWGAIVALSWPIVWAASAAVFAGGSGLLTLPASRLAVWLTWIGFGMFAQVYRLWRVAGTLQRQQTKWLLASNWILFVGAMLVFPARFLADADLPGALRAAVVLPVLLLSTAIFGAGFWIAILRYRLWDIDIVVRRTAVYGTVTAGLVATYLAAVVTIQAGLRPFTSGSELAVAASTLLVVALFQPFRSRVQGVVDRSFYRSRYDAVRTLDAFGTRLRNEVELDAVRADLLGVVRETIRPAHASVWLRERTS